MRVFALSDVHSDFRENLLLIAGLPPRTHREDALIVAGDVTHDLARLRQSFEIFLERFRHVFFIPGNHELWIRKGEHADSVEKFHHVLRVCDSLGVHTGPKYIGDGSGRVCVVPLFSWYTRPGEGSDTLFRARPIDSSGASVWADDHLVHWPGADFDPTGFFLGMNEPRVSATYDAPVISASHFLPRADLMFAGEGEVVHAPSGSERHFNFSTVAGSSRIEQQIRRLGSSVHIYGHQHRNRCRHYDGVWYVSNCLGYGEERKVGKVRTPASIVKAVWPLEEAGLNAIPQACGA